MQGATSAVWRILDWRFIMRKSLISKENMHLYLYVYGYKYEFLWTSFCIDSRLFFSLFATNIGGPCWPDDRMQVFVTSPLSCFLKPETLPIFSCNQWLGCVCFGKRLSVCTSYMWNLWVRCEQSFLYLVVILSLQQSVSKKNLTKGQIIKDSCAEGLKWLQVTSDMNT